MEGLELEVDGEMEAERVEPPVSHSGGGRRERSQRRGGEEREGCIHVAGN